MHQEGTYANGSFSFASFTYTEHINNNQYDSVGGTWARLITTETRAIAGTGHGGTLTVTTSAAYTFNDRDPESYNPPPTTQPVTLDGIAPPSVAIDTPTMATLTLLQYFCNC